MLTPRACQLADKVLFDCDAKMPLSERLCPCSEVDKVKAERERLRTILAKEQELKLKEVGAAGLWL